MKFIINRSLFQKAISRTEAIISVREIQSVLSNVLIVADAKHVRLTSSDLEVSTSIVVEAQIEREGSLTLPARKLSQIIAEYQSEEITLDADLESIKVEIYKGAKLGKSKVFLMGSPASEYPSVIFPEPSQHTNLKAKTLKAMLQYTHYAMAKDDARYVFNGLLMKASEKELCFVATDGRRLSICSSTLEDGCTL